MRELSNILGWTGYPGIFFITGIQPKYKISYPDGYQILYSADRWPTVYLKPDIRYSVEYFARYPVGYQIQYPAFAGLTQRPVIRSILYLVDIQKNPYKIVKKILM